MHPKQTRQEIERQIRLQELSAICSDHKRILLDLHKRARAQSVRAYIERIHNGKD